MTGNVPTACARPKDLYVDTLVALGRGIPSDAGSVRQPRAPSIQILQTAHRVRCGTQV
jgi:hypothetical protein